MQALRQRCRAGRAAARHGAALSAGGKPRRRGSMRRDGPDGRDPRREGTADGAPLPAGGVRGHGAHPRSLAVWGIDSGIRHAVSGADYGSVRVGAFMGYRVLAELAGLRVYPGARDGHVRIDDPRWHGYLANVTPDEFEAHAAQIPERMLGRRLPRALWRHDGSGDAWWTRRPSTLCAFLPGIRSPNTGACCGGDSGWKRLPGGPRQTRTNWPRSSAR